MKSLHLICFTIFILLAPIALFVFLIFALLQRCIGLYLHLRLGPKFRGFLEGQDVIWAMGDSRARGVVNVMSYIVVDKRAYQPTTSATKIFVEFSRRFKDALLLGHDHPKFYYQRKYFGGYYYWFHEDRGKIEKYVRALKIDTPNEFITFEELREKLCEMGNDELPDGGTRNWELLLGNKPIEAEDCVKFPVSRTLKKNSQYI